MDRFRNVAPFEQKVYDMDADPVDLAKTILLVEDDAAFAEIVKEYLEFCDLLMPNLPGDMFYIGVERVKPRLAKRFIFITGHQNNPKISEFIKKVRALTLFKPFEMHTLVETINVALKNAHKKS
jgi:hypothetical protein